MFLFLQLYSHDKILKHFIGKGKFNIFGVVKVCKIIGPVYIYNITIWSYASRTLANTFSSHHSWSSEQCHKYAWLWYFHILLTKEIIHLIVISHSLVMVFMHFLNAVVSGRWENIIDAHTCAVLDTQSSSQSFQIFCWWWYSHMYV